MENSGELKDYEALNDAATKTEMDFNEPTLKLQGLTHRLHIMDTSVRGSHQLTLRGLPAGLKVFLAEAVEINIHDNTPHRGHAVYSTSSVNLHANDRFAIIRFNVGWKAPLKTGIMIVMG